MSNDIKKIQKQRFQFLRKAYESSKGSTLELLDGEVVCRSLGFNTPLCDRIIQYLIDEGLINSGIPDGASGISIPISITQDGIKEVEKALSHPDRKTEHFPPINIIQIDTMTNSQIQQASPGATQVVTINESEKKKLEEIIQSLKSQIAELKLQPEEENDLQADIATIEAQMASSKPKKSIVIESLKAILVGAAGSLFASGLVRQISTWIGC